MQDAGYYIWIASKYLWRTNFLNRLVIAQCHLKWSTKWPFLISFSDTWSFDFKLDLISCYHFSLRCFCPYFCLIRSFSSSMLFNLLFFFFLIYPFPSFHDTSQTQILKIFRFGYFLHIINFKYFVMGEKFISSS